MRARLLVEAGEAIPAAVEIEPGQSVRIGRHRDNTIVLRDEHASRWHAEMLCNQGRWFIRNVGNPLNGTRIDGTRIEEEAPLANGQEIGIGDTRLRFVQDAVEADSLATPPGEGASVELADVPETSELPATPLRADELTVLCHFMSESASDSEPHVLIRRALSTILGQTGATLAGFLSLDPNNPLPKLVLPELAHVDFHLSRQLTQKAQSEGRAIWLGSNVVNKEPSSESLMPFTDAICLPLLAKGAPLGALHVYKTNVYFTERHVRFCEVLAGYLVNSLHVLRARRNLEAENTRLRNHLPASDELVGDSGAMQQLRQVIARVAARPSIVLIQGESGVGKELIALALHRQSTRGNGPLVVLNCAAIAPALVEAELFGYCKGAFTGAGRDHPGLFQQADEGTLFLDEVGELPLDLQAKLLRVIEGRGFRPVGACAEVHADVRIIAATHCDLEKEVKKRRFREDLYFRLRVVHIPVPPLRERREDIPVLVKYFLDRLAVEYRRQIELTDPALERLREYSWPGNVRQLRAVLESAVVMSDKDTLDADDLRLLGETPAQPPPTLNLEELEDWAIRRALKQTGGNITQAARLLGIARDTLGQKIKRRGIERPEGPDSSSK